MAELVAPIGGYVQGSTTVFGVAFGPGPIRSMREGWRNDAERVMALKRELRLRGVYTKPTPRDIWYVSTEHTDADVETTLGDRRRGSSGGEVGSGVRVMNGRCDG